MKGDGIVENTLLSQNVVLLAKNFKLTEPQYDLLNRGLTFVPTLKKDKNHYSQLQLDLQDYHRKLKLADYFRDSSGEKRPFTGPSLWSPSLTEISPEITELIQKDKNIFNNHYNSLDRNFKINNLNSEELNALKELKSMKHIVIKPADKGSAVVIMDREQYTLEAQRQLNDLTYYKRLERPIYLETIPLVRDILLRLKKKKFINAKQLQYLQGDLHPRERRFYILPKIHKDPTTWTVPFEVPKGRPIVSDCSSETYHTTEFLDYFLNPLSTRHPSYVKDTYHFVDVVKNLNLPSQFYFFSMDVASLYTNIDIDAGLSAVKKIFHKYPDPRRPDQELLELLDINLRRNDFVFDDQFYLQVKGTAMGKRFAPAYANIFMANWEEEVFQKCKKKPLHYFRYLDDIWGIWDGSREEFQLFVSILNLHDPSIQLEAEIDANSIDFLDTTVFKGADFASTGKLDIRVFFKKTDLHALLFKSSHHPKHTFAGLVKSQLLRFFRICTKREDFMSAVEVLFKSLRKRGYSRQFLRNCLKNYLISKPKYVGKLIPLITTFDSISKKFNDQWKTNFYRAKILQNFKIISAYRRNPNLRDLLVFAKLPSLKSGKPQKYLEQFAKLKFIKNSKEKNVLKITQSFSTRSSNCVYVIFCVKCNQKYVGETRNTLFTRLMQHRYNIRNRKETHTLVVQHFLMHGLSSLRLAGLQTSPVWTDWERKKVERRWIFLLGTREPNGLNLKNN